MGNEQSTPSKTDGQVDGRPVTFTCSQNEGEDKQLIWKDNGTQEEGRISDQDIIAALPVHAQVPDDYSVLYVEPNPAADNDSTASPVIFRSIVATKLPQAFIHDQQPPGNACWQTRQDDGRIPNLHIVVSTGSGMGRAEGVFKDLLKPMLQHVCPGSDKYEVHVTSSEHTVTELTRELFLPQANLGVMQAIILLSGDGGLVDVINALLSSEHGRNYKKPNVSLLPLGTGNAMAHSAGSTADNTMGLKNLLQGMTKELPLFRASFSPGACQVVNEGRDEKPLHIVKGTPVVYGAVVCSWGLHATLVADSDTTEYRKFGAERFKMAAKESLFPSDGSPPHGYRGKVSILRPSANARDGWEAIERESHGYILATLVSQLEKGFTISPATKPLDGKLRLVHFSALRGQEAMEVMGKAYDGGKHVGDERIGYDEIDSVRIDFDEDDARWRRVCVDGKIIRVEKGGWVEVRSGMKGVVDLIVK